MNGKWWIRRALLLAAALLLVSCQVQTVKVTRVVTETVVEEGEAVEVTRVIVEEVPVEVTRQVVEEVVVTQRGAGGSLNILYWQAVSTLNPYLGGGMKDLHAASLILEPLARYDESGRLVPWLAAEIPTLENGGIAADLMSMTWTLRDDVLWSDGAPFTAADVVFTGEYCLGITGCVAAQRFADVAGFEAVDDQTVTVNFAKPKPFPYGPFVSDASPILQKAQFEACRGEAAQECTEQNFGPIGSGPYQVKEFRANDTVLYEVNPNYRDPDKPFFSEVVIKGGGDAASAARAVLETGEADYAWNLQVEPQLLNAMSLAGFGKIATSFGTAVERVAINFTNPDPELGDQRSVFSPDAPNPHPALSDPAVRQALSLAIDRNTIVAQLYGPGGRPTCNIVPAPAAYVSTANDSCLVQDIAAANQLLDDAGWAHGADGVRQKDGARLSFLFQTSTNAVREAVQALIKQWWAQIGVETELRSIDPAVYFSGDPASPDTFFKFFADVQMYMHSFPGADPESYMGNWTCGRIPGPSNNWLGTNVPRYCNADYDARVAELSQTAEPAARSELVKQLNDILMQDYVELPLVHRGNVSAHSHTLLGVRINAWDSELWNIADWTRASQ